MELQTTLTADLAQQVTVSMTTREYLQFVQYMGGQTQRPQRRILKGLAGICELFQCSQAQAFKIAHAEWFQPAVVKMGRMMVFDADLAWELAHNQNIKPAA